MKHAKKCMLLIFLLIVIMLLLCSCETVVDTHHYSANATNTKAYIKINEETIDVDVSSYLYGSDGVVIIYSTDGKIYKTHSANVVLVYDN